MLTPEDDLAALAVGAEDLATYACEPADLVPHDGDCKVCATFHRAGHVVQDDWREVTVCAQCSRTFHRNDTGRPAVYCSETCKNAAYRARRREKAKSR